MIVPSHSVQFFYHRMFLLHKQKCSNPSSAHVVVISLAHLPDVDVLQFSFLAPYPANVVGLIDVLIEWQKRMMLLMMSSSVEMMKIIEMRKIISFAIE